MDGKCILCARLKDGDYFEVELHNDGWLGDVSRLITEDEVEAVVLQKVSKNVPIGRIRRAWFTEPSPASIRKQQQKENMEKKKLILLRLQVIKTYLNCGET